MYRFLFAFLAVAFLATAAQAQKRGFMAW